MTTNKAVIDDFLRGGSSEKTKNLKTIKKGNSSVLYNYATPIAYRDSTGQVYQTDKKFSSSTSTIQNQIFGEKVKNDVFKEFVEKETYETGRL